MRQEAYTIMHEAEGSWWHDGRSHTAKKILDSFGAGRDLRILDVGAGLGAQLPLLSRYGHVTAFEPNTLARESCHARGYAEVSDATDIGVLADERAGQFDLIALFDVLEHVADERPFLASLSKLLAPGGRLIVNVPAYQFLWTKFDEAALHFRRYTCRTLVQALEENGFDVSYASYWNMLLFIPAALVRLAGKSGESATQLPRWLDRLFYGIVAGEDSVIPTLSLPFGTSVIALAKKR